MKMDSGIRIQLELTTTGKKEQIFATVMDSSILANVCFYYDKETVLLVFSLNKSIVV